MVLALPFGLASGFYQWTAPPSGLSLLRTAVIAFFLPAVFEELVFRGPLLWAQTNLDEVPAWAIGLSLAAFVAWHPINAHTLLPQADPVFLDVRFLAIAALLGAVATLMALKTRSLWPPILFHWSVVVGWKATLGAPGFL